MTEFDEQLTALEQILGPLAEWSRTWAEFEQQHLQAEEKKVRSSIFSPAMARSGLAAAA